MSDDQQRTLTAEFNAISQYFTEEDGWLPGPVFNVPGAYSYIGSNTWVEETTIDLSGYALQKKSFFPYSSFEQLGGVTGATVVDAVLTQQPYIQDMTIVSSIPMDSQELSIGLSKHPGFFGAYGYGRFNRDVILHGTSRSYTMDTSISVPTAYANFIISSQQSFSSLEPTAADKLYCYRVVAWYGDISENTTFQVPAKRVLMPGTISSEPKEEYMMRLKRSYELANQE